VVVAVAATSENLLPSTPTWVSIQVMLRPNLFCEALPTAEDPQLLIRPIQDTPVPLDHHVKNKRFPRDTKYSPGGVFCLVLFFPFFPFCPFVVSHKTPYLFYVRSCLILFAPTLESTNWLDIPWRANTTPKYPRLARFFDGVLKFAWFSVALANCFFFVLWILYALFLFSLCVLRALFVLFRLVLVLDGEYTETSGIPI